MAPDDILVSLEHEASSARCAHANLVTGLQASFFQGLHREGRLMLRTDSREPAPSFLYFLHLEVRVSRWRALRQAHVRGEPWTRGIARGFDSFQKEPDLQERWRRRESNPRPRSHRPSVYKLSPPLQSRPVGRRTDALPPGQPSLEVAPQAIGSPLAPSPFVDADSEPRAQPGSTRHLVLTD
jgi:hypothetical protein